MEEVLQTEYQALDAKFIPGERGCIRPEPVGHVFQRAASAHSIRGEKVANMSKFFPCLL
jgi:hypothetical protein